MLQIAQGRETGSRLHGQRRGAFRGQVIHDIGGAGPIYAAAEAPGGRRYFSDEHHHRILVEEPSGYRWSFGTLGSGAGELRHPRGLALLPGCSADDSQLFVCDAWNHRVQVFDGRGRVRFTFGTSGSGDGQFDMPSDVVVVRPEFPGEDLEAQPLSGVWLAVADRWNNRVQVFELDGAFVGSIGTGPGAPSARADARAPLGRPGMEAAGWPFFRGSLEPAMWFPIRLSWKAPCLEIVSANSQVTRVNLALALLPDFDAWLGAASIRDLLRARSTFRARDPEAAPPPEVLAAIDTRLGAVQLAAGRVRDAERAWARPWPRGTAPRAVERQLALRVQAVEAALAPSGGRGGGALVQNLAEAVSAEERRRAREAAEQCLMDARGAEVEELPRSAGRRRRHGCATSHAGRFDRAAGGGGAGTSPAGAHHLSCLSARLADLRGDVHLEADIAWSAPPGAGQLQHAVTAHGVLAVVEEREPAVWLFDARCRPLSRFSLPAGARPRGIAPGPRRGWFVTDVQHDCVMQLDETGKIVRLWGGRGDDPARLRSPLGLAFANGRLYVADRDNDRVQVFDADGRPVNVYPRLGAPSAVAVDRNSLWVAEWGRPALRRIDRRTGRTLVSLRHADLSSPVSVARDRNTVVAADRFRASVLVFDATGRWNKRVWRAAGRPFGSLSAVAIWRGHAIAVDRDHGRLLRFTLPGRKST